MAIHEPSKHIASNTKAQTHSLTMVSPNKESTRITSTRACIALKNERLRKLENGRDGVALNQTHKRTNTHTHTHTQQSISRYISNSVLNETQKLSHDQRAIVAGERGGGGEAVIQKLCFGWCHLGNHRKPFSYYLLPCRSTTRSIRSTKK